MKEKAGKSLKKTKAAKEKMEMKKMIKHEKRKWKWKRNDKKMKRENGNEKTW